MSIREASPPAPPGSGDRPRSLIVLLWVLCGGVLTQAALAGLFLSGIHQARLAHIIVGWLLPYAAIPVAIVAAVCHTRRTCPARHAIAIYPLPVLLWIQEVLGHVPVQVSTAIHVPLGVTLAVYPAALAVLIGVSLPRGDGRPSP